MTKHLTKGSIISSLTIILFLISRVFQVADLTLLTFSSILVCMSIIKFGTKSSMIIISSSLIGSIVCGVIEYSILYLLFFGTYPLVKYYIERINSLLREFLIKIIYFNIIFISIFFVYIRLFLPININFNVLIAIVTSFSVLFVMYDIFLTQIIRYIYLNKIIRNL